MPARERALAAPESWLGLAGLYWLEDGRNRVGADPEAAVVLPHGPACLGEILWRGNALQWLPMDGEVQSLTAIVMVRRRSWPRATVHSSSSSVTAVLRCVRDLAWAARTPFAGIDRFDYDPAWRIDGLVAARPAAGDGSAQRDRRTEAGDGAHGRLSTLWASRLPAADERSDEKVFFVFPRRRAVGSAMALGASSMCRRPQTAASSPISTTPTVALCFYAAFATCPLPPPENWLPFSIEAGERRYVG